MKIVTLNIQHGGGKRIPGILDYLQSLDADVIVFTEFRENKNAELLRSSFGKLDYRYFAASSNDPKQNAVCIISRQPFVPRMYPMLSAQDRHRLLSAHFEGVAIYAVYFSQNKAKASLFQFLIAGSHLPPQGTYIIVGDFNTGLHILDEEGATFYCTNEFKALSKNGVVDSWRSRNPDVKEFSWYSNHGNGFRIDHVFSSPEADELIQEVYYDHKPRNSRLTDHSALVLEYVS